MRFVLLLLIAAVPPPAALQCDAAKAKAAEFRKGLDAWIAGHNAACPLCAAGTACREGFEKREASRKQLEAWKRDHSAVCVPCAALKCTAGDELLEAWIVDAYARHKEKHILCEPERCDPWKAIVADLRKQLDAWKRDHPATCDKCSPLCAEWRKRAGEVDTRSADTIKRHQDRCSDCKAGGCERLGLLQAEWGKERLAAWKRHGEVCPCARTPKK